MHTVIAHTRLEVNASYRLRASERLEDGQKLFRELKQYAPHVEVSNVDGTIKLVGVSNPLELLHKLGFSGTTKDLPVLCRQDMNVKLVKPRDAWDDILFIIPH